jgi:hypothetical protein
LRRVEETIRVHGIGYVMAFSINRVRSFDDYRGMIPRGLPDRRLLDELRRDGVLQQLGILQRPRRLFNFRVPFLWKQGNLIVDVGKQYTSDLLIGDVTGSFTHMGVGSSTQSPAAGDTALVTPQGARIAIDTNGDRYRAGNNAHWDGFFNSSHGSNGTTINETGVFTALTGGTMWNRSLLSPGISKTSSNTVTIAIKGQW